MKAQQATIRDLMPKGFTNILVKETRRPQSYISRVIKNEETGSPIWPNILKLAEETKKQRLEEAAKLEALKKVA